MTVTDTAHMYEAFNLGRTHADMSSLYPSIMRTGKFPYEDTDSCKNEELRTWEYKG